jgi:hypothetical protein
MSTVSILELPYITEIQSNTANTVLVGVDVPLNLTGQITLTTIAGNLYSNNNLKVGNNDIIYANAVGQFTGNSVEYLQVTVRNQESVGSGDFVVTADDGTDGSNYIDMGLNGSAYNDPDYSAMKSHDGYLYVRSTNGANLVLGTTASDGRIKFIIGGTEDTNIVSYISSSGVFSPAIDSLVSANVATLRGEITANAAHANSVINTRITANVATLRGEITSNAAHANSVINTRITANVATLRGEITSNAVSTNAFANLAFTKANNALANTTGTFAGSLTTTGNVIVKYALTVNNTSMPGNTQYLVVTGTSTGAIGTPSNPGYTFHSATEGEGNRVVAEAYSNQANDYASFIGRRARGTADTPSGIQTGDVIVRFGGNGYGNTKFSQFADARIEFVATENHTDLAKGTRIRFLNTREGSNVSTEIATFNANTVTFTGAVTPEKGFIYTANVLPTVSSFTIDFERDNLIKFNVIDNLTISLSNYVFGKVVEMWITNSAAQNKTITHGCFANNSTSKSTTFTILSQSCAYLRYFSINGDKVNTFVSITA